MLTKIDWISFSVLLPDFVVYDERDKEKQLMVAVGLLSPSLFSWLDFAAGWTRESGRAPYSVAWKHPDGGISAYYHPRLPHALIEISGRGCDFLHERGVLTDVLDAVKSRVTRIDIATDFLNDVRPHEFGELRDKGRFKSFSTIQSESGETYYVGAKTSNRYARVYRYNAPHERHMFLRVEYVIKAEDAKICAMVILSDGLTKVAAHLGERFGWKHDSYVPEAPTAAEMSTYRADRREGKTLYWLGKTVAPLLRRLGEEGVIDLRTWVEANLFNER